MKKILKQTCGRLFRSLMLFGTFFKNVRIILMYHRVVEKLPEDFCDPALFVTADTFEMHLKLLSEFFDIVSLESMIKTNQKGRCCSITFDDGWQDNYEFAFPLLKKYQVPATVFLPAGMIGSSEWFWFEKLRFLYKDLKLNGNPQHFIKYFQDRIPYWKPESMGSELLSDLTSIIKHLSGESIDDLMTGAYVDLNVKPPSQKIIMNWDDVSEMGRSGITFGPHGLRHYMLPTIEYKVKKKEIIESLEVLRDKGVPAVPFFSYPNGDWDDQSIALLYEAGYHGAVTTRLGCITSQTPPFLLNRVGIHEYISHSPSLFWFRLFQAIISSSELMQDSH
jgi:peptidoglycan/xylan/chitin deacetylase (PgdA/CDA1 family)